MTLPITNRTAAAYLKGAVLQGCDSNNMRLRARQQLAAEPVVEVISGVLVRLTTCQRLTNSLPKLSVITLFPPETAG